MEKMKINIWSDIRCPFCYIGKRKFEKAVEGFPHKNQLEINWQSFQLEPDLKTEPDMNSITHFSQRKGVSPDQVKQMYAQVEQVASEIGLDFQLDSSVVANSFNAHRLIQFAQSQGLGNEVEETLFKAYFTENKNIDDKATLLEIGVSIGLDKKDVESLLASDAFSEKVNQDMTDAQALGINGVPFFVFNDKYAVSGAQSPEVFLQTIEHAWKEFEKNHEPQKLVITDGQSCSTDGSCN